MLLSIGIAAVTIEQFVHLCRPDFVSKKARPPLTAETIRRYEAERAKLTRDFHWNWRLIPFRISRRLHLAQPVEILWRQVRIRVSHPIPTAG
jgi:hypothetical protein